MPFPSARVIHDLWAEHNRPVAEGAHNGKCIILPAGSAGSGGGWDPITGIVPSSAVETPSPLYRGTCMIQFAAAAPRTADAAGQATVEHPYLVSIRHPTDVPVGARLHVTEFADDPELVGKVLTVADVQYGTVWDRILSCDLDLTNQEA